ncbi:MAG: hypothetical protein EP318_03190 [Rhodobacteraceae bacterium]|nr:MAG: hypothetical protein EP318_03190 [Paracoccaceae bacterium]
MKDCVKTGAELPQDGTPVILVVEHDTLIADDIAGSLMAACACRVIHVRHPADILSSLIHEARVFAAFLEMRLSQVLESGLDRSLAERGARIILTRGDEDEDEVRALGWGMLVRPFSDRMIRDAVSSLKLPCR